MFNTLKKIYNHPHSKGLRAGLSTAINYPVFPNWPSLNFITIKNLLLFSLFLHLLIVPLPLAIPALIGFCIDLVTYTAIFAAIDLTFRLLFKVSITFTNSTLLGESIRAGKEAANIAAVRQGIVSPLGRFHETYNTSEGLTHHNIVDYSQKLLGHNKGVEDEIRQGVTRGFYFARQQVQHVAAEASNVVHDAFKGCSK